LGNVVVCLMIAISYRRRAWLAVLLSGRDEAPPWMTDEILEVLLFDVFCVFSYVIDMWQEVERLAAMLRLNRDVHLEWYQRLIIQEGSSS